jgi:hypothetical protein
MLGQIVAGKKDNRSQSRSGLISGCNRSGTVPESDRPQKTGPYQSSPVFSLFGNLPDRLRLRLPHLDVEKPDRTGLSNTNNDHNYNHSHHLPLTTTSTTSTRPPQRKRPPQPPPVHLNVNDHTSYTFNTKQQYVWLQTCHVTSVWAL